MRWFRNLGEQLRPRRKLVVHSDDTLPNVLPRRDLVVARDDDGETWCVGMVCPCGCGDTLELMLIPEARPRWTLIDGGRRGPTLHPSVWRDQRCGSHFWVRRGRVRWC